MRDRSNDPSHHERAIYHRSTSCYFLVIINGRYRKSIRHINMFGTYNMYARVKVTLFEKFGNVCESVMLNEVFHCWSVIVVCVKDSMSCTF